MQQIRSALSLFNGISGLHLALDKAQINVEQVYYSEIRKLLGINEQKLKDELNKMKRLHESAIKTNETLVKFKNDLLKENEDLVEKLNAYSFITFWQRLLFLFTGKVN